MKRSHAVAPGDPALQSINAETGEPADLSVLEEASVAFDPSNQHLDLTKDERRRTTALLMAIQAYDKLIIKDSEMYVAIQRESGHNPECKIRPATIHAMLEAAINFDMFIAGRLTPDPALEKVNDVIEDVMEKK